MPAFQFPQTCARFDVSQPPSVAFDQRWTQADVGLGRAVFATQTMLRVVVFRSVAGHQELVTENGEVVTYDGEDVWIMVPDA